MNHVDAPYDNTKQSVGFENKLKPFWSHDALKSNFMVPIECHEHKIMKTNDEEIYLNLNPNI
jgi:hypothetical protein